MRSIACGLLLLAFALPARAAHESPRRKPRALLAQVWRPAPPRAAPAPRVSPAPRVAPAPAPYRVVPAPPPGAPLRPRGWYYGPGWYPGYYVSPWAYSVYLGAPPWWGWGWGYGWYPMYPSPPPPPAGEVAPSRRVTAEVAFTAGPTRQRAFNDPARVVGPGASGGVSLRVEGQRFGLQAGYDGFFTDGTLSFGHSSALEHGTVLLTWSALSGENGRLRVEAGLAVTGWPRVYPYASTTSLGPDLGVSGHLGLVGPLGLQGHARISPAPRQVTDLALAAALRFGPAAVTAGWRDLRAEGGTTEPNLRFAGPHFGLAVLF